MMEISMSYDYSQFFCFDGIVLIEEINSNGEKNSILQPGFDNAEFV